MSGFITIKKFQVTPDNAAPGGYASLFVDTDNRLKLLLDNGSIYTYGLNNFELAQSEGFTGTLSEYIESLKGESAYQLWLSLGHEGSEQDFLNSLKGLDGADGTDGADGASAYQTWLSAGNTGTEADFLASLKGDKGDQGTPGTPGEPGADGSDGAPGADGASAYQTWLSAGNTGTEDDFLASLKGDKGDPGTPGADGSNGAPGTPGANGASAYEIWLSLGNTGSQQDFINSLKGADGTSGSGGSGLISQDTAPTDTATYKLWFDTTTLKLKVFVTALNTYIDAFPVAKGSDGASAYQTWLSLGNSGTEADFIASLSAGGSTSNIFDNSIKVMRGVSNTMSYHNWGMGPFYVTGSTTTHTASVGQSYAYQYFGCTEQLATTASTAAVAGCYQMTNLIPMALNANKRLKICMDNGIADGTQNAQHRYFMGMRVATNSLTDNDPSVLLNIVGFGYSAADTEFQFMYRGSGAVTKIPTGIPKASVNRKHVYRAIFETMSSTQMRVSLQDLNNATVFTTTFNPSEVTGLNGTMMGLVSYISAGGTSSTVGTGFFTWTILDRNEF